MKRVSLLSTSLFVLAVVLFLSSCRTAVPASDKITIITTIFPQYDFVRHIVGDQAEVIMLLRPGAESHSYEPPPRDIIKIKNSSAFIYIGGESDQWAKKILDSMDTSKMTIITLLDCVPAVREELVEGMQPEEEESTAYDEHIWTSPRNAKLIVEKITVALCALDSANAAEYQRNAENYLSDLNELDKEFRILVKDAKRKTLIFGDRFPFRYFVDEYGLKYFAAFPGCSTETEVTPATLRFLIDKVRQEEIPVIFHIELSNQKVAQAIAEATGAQVRQLHSVHNIIREDFQNGLGYLDFMRQNIAVLREALY